MRLALVGLVAVVAATPSVTAPGNVTTLAMDGANVAFAVEKLPRDCDRIWLWNRTSGKLVRFPRPSSCISTSTGHGIASVSIARTRLLWLHFTGGNIREWTLYTATTTVPKPRRLAFVARNVDAPPPIVLGEGHSFLRYGSSLPYAVDRNVVVLDARGARRGAWRESERVTAIAGAREAVAVATADGRVSIRESSDWTKVADSWTDPRPASAIFFSGTSVVAQRGRTIDVRAAGSTRRVTVPAGAVLRDAAGTRALYTSRGRVTLLDLDSGATRDLGPGTAAQLEYSTVAVASGARIRAFRPQ